MRRPLGAAVLFGLAIAGGEDVDPPAPFDSPDPVVTMAATFVAQSLVLAGRPEEALAVFEGATARTNTIERLGPRLVGHGPYPLRASG